MTVPQSPGPMSRCLQVCPTARENAETQSKNWFTPDKARGQCLQVCAPVPYGALGWAACDLVEKRFRPVASAATKVSPLASCFTEKLAVKTSLALWFFAQEPHRCVGGKEKKIYIHIYTFTTSATRATRISVWKDFWVIKPSLVIKYREEMQSAKLLPFHVACFATQVLWTNVSNVSAEAMGFCAVAIPAHSYP